MLPQVTQINTYFSLPQRHPPSLKLPTSSRYKTSGLRRTSRRTDKEKLGRGCPKGRRLKTDDGGRMRDDGRETRGKIRSTNPFDLVRLFRLLRFHSLRQAQGRRTGGFLIGYFHPGFGDCPTAWTHCRPFPSNLTLALSMSILTIFTFFV
jgi:hypothetical protein